MRRRATRRFSIANPGNFVFPFVGAAAFYSVRIPAGSSYSGPLLRVRRSSDNAESDIGAVATADTNGNRFLDTSALLTFVGANSGFVTTWYDQSGNARNATQTNTSKQPRIVNAGVVDTAGGLPAIVFSGAQTLVTPTVLARNTFPNAFVNCVYQNTNITTGTQGLWGGDSSNWPRFQTMSFSTISWGLSFGVGVVQQTALLNNTNRNVYTFVSQYLTTNGSNLWVNGSIGTAFTETSAGTAANLAIGGISDATPGYVGNMQEFSYGFFAPAEAARVRVQRNQGAAFGITVL